MNFQQRLQVFWAELSHFPWQDTLLTLKGRFREDHMGLTASSLTFTTTIALVPFFTVALAVFTAFPMFSKMQGALQGWLIDSLIPGYTQLVGLFTELRQVAQHLAGNVVGDQALNQPALQRTLQFRKHREGRKNSQCHSKKRYKCDRGCKGQTAGCQAHVVFTEAVTQSKRSAAPGKSRQVKPEGL